MQPMLPVFVWLETRVALKCKTQSHITENAIPVILCINNKPQNPPAKHGNNYKTQQQIGKTQQINEWHVKAQQIDKVSDKLQNNTT